MLFSESLKVDDTVWPIIRVQREWTLNSHFETGHPAPILKPFISHYGGARVHGLTPGVNTTLPSRHAHLIISLGAPINVRQMSSGGQPASCLPALVAGIHDGFAIVERARAWEGVH